MVNFIAGAFGSFAAETGILGKLQGYESLGMILLAGVGILSCFFGMKCYRIAFSVMAFIVVTLVCVWLMRNRIQWGSVVTAFSILGCASAFIVYHWQRTGAAVISGLIAASIAGFFFASPVTMVILGIIFCTVAWLFPSIVTCLMTAIWGAWILADLMTMMRIPFQELGFVGLILAGLMVQFFTNCGEKNFKALYPVKLQRYLDHRKREKKHA